MPKQQCKGPSKSPHIGCGENVQCVEDDDGPSLNSHQIRPVQQVVRKFLSLARAMDNGQPRVLKDSAHKVSKATEETLAAARHPLNCVVCKLRPSIKHGASQMISEVESIKHSF